MSAKVKVRTDKDGALHVYGDDGKEITNISSVAVDYDAVSGQAFISIVYEADVDIDAEGLLIEALE